MEFIKAEEFLKQSVEIQKVLLDWWKPSPGNLYVDTLENMYLVLEEQTDQERWDRLKASGEIIPLFLEGQLRQFIEDKKNGIIDITHDICNGGYNFEIWLINEMKRLDNDEYFSLGNNLLQAYWKVAIEIAKSESNE